MKSVAVLGSTGSIGTATLDVVGGHGDDFRISALAAGGNVRLLKEQVLRFHPKIVSLRTKKDAEAFRRICRKPGLRVTFGPEGAEEVARRPESDVVVAAISGFDGLRSTLAAVEEGKTVALANKESMVVAGPILLRKAARTKARILPVDSEHSGVFQCLAGVRKSQVRKIILTASGGPFFKTPLRELKSRTPAEALKHPRWTMGRKVTIDSATLMNKGLELHEARWLFSVEPARLDVLIHPQSAVHALVELADGSILAQLAPADMRIPIQLALTHPRRLETAVSRLDLADVRSLEFFPVEEKRYPLFGLARRALEEGKSFPVVLNAANEIAVDAFLSGKIGFLEIASVVAAVMDGHVSRPVPDLETVREADAEARRRAGREIGKRSI
ncbi:MAG: 1-deoxy-D-xylulose-5-phosphate reductoisomerase [Acidobacteriota bacterium]|nr:1-deoxy-D-xylulose-5-phosphate reductoisomerase [Acidobacteriota bacterium]